MTKTDKERVYVGRQLVIVSGIKSFAIYVPGSVWFWCEEMLDWKYSFCEAYVYMRLSKHVYVFSCYRILNFVDLEKLNVLFTPRSSFCQTCCTMLVIWLLSIKTGVNVTFLTEYNKKGF